MGIYLTFLLSEVCWISGLGFGVCIGVGLFTREER